jgi:exodeoxyribonuclease VII small subunit
MARRKTSAKESESDPSFEEALAGLESIVEAMEHEQLPLEELVAYYEKGSTLLDRCESVLQSARGRIELITLRNKNDSEAVASSSKQETGEASSPSDDSDTSDDNDDIRLF